MDAILNAETVGQEQLILLPIEQKIFDLHTESSIDVSVNTGRDAIVLSGYGVVKASNASTAVVKGPPFGFGLDVESDDIFSKHDFDILVGPRWRDVVQVSASVSMAGIFSDDSDEVDRSLWNIEGCTWNEASASGAKRINLCVNLNTMGDGNGWINFAYHLVATGNLMRMPTPDELSADLS